MEQAEWKILPHAIDLIANGKVTVKDGRVSLPVMRRRSTNESIDRRRWRKRTRNCILCSKEQQGREDVLCTGKCRDCRACECVPIGAMEFDKLVTFAKEKEIDLAIVGMDDPLVGGPYR